MKILFLHPWIFWGGVSMILCLFVCIFFTKQERNFSNFELLQKIYQVSSKHYRIFLSSQIIIGVLFVLYMSGIHIEIENSEKITQHRDIDIVLDLSYSMVASDIDPDRLTAAKNIMGSFIDVLEGERIGLVLFAGTVFESIPFTSDYDFIRDFLEDLDIDQIDQTQEAFQGTALGDGLIVSVNRHLQNSQEEKHEKAIIIFTDGEANKGVDMMLALAYAKEHKIRIYTIGVGSGGETTIRAEVYPGIFQDIRVAAIDEETLQKVANETGGKYFHAHSLDALTQIARDIQQLEQSSVRQEIRKEKRFIYEYILWGILVMFILQAYYMFYKRVEL